MEDNNLIVQRLLALFAAGWLLFNYPLLALFGRVGAAGGIPSLYLYLFLAWGLLIAAIAVVVEFCAGD